MKMKRLNLKLQAWIDARRRRRLSHAQVQMARELGMNPAKLGKIDNHKQERWKMPLPQFLEHLYRKRFGKSAPETVMSIEDRAHLDQQKKEARRVAKQQRKCAQTGCNGTSSTAERPPVEALPTSLS